MLQYSPKLAQTRLGQKLSKDLFQASPTSLMRDHSSDVGPFFVQLAQTSLITPRREVT